jgi:hypothetical protein
VKDLSSDTVGMQLCASRLTRSSRSTDDRSQGRHPGTSPRGADLLTSIPKYQCAPGIEHAECLGALGKARKAVAHRVADDARDEDEIALYPY